MMTTPILTMRTFSEERKLKTDQMLITSPVKVSAIVSGKFLAAATVFFVTLVIHSLDAIIISFFSTNMFFIDIFVAYMRSVFGRLYLHCHWHIGFVHDREPGGFCHCDVCGHAFGVCSAVDDFFNFFFHCSRHHYLLCDCFGNYCPALLYHQKLDCVPLCVCRACGCDCSSNF